MSCLLFYVFFCFCLKGGGAAGSLPQCSSLSVLLSEVAEENAVIPAEAPSESFPSTQQHVSDKAPFGGGNDVVCLLCLRLFFSLLAFPPSSLLSVELGELHEGVYRLNGSNSVICNFSS